MNKLHFVDSAATPTSIEPGFFLEEAELRRRKTAKWSAFAPEIFPAFVAEMDFKISPNIQRAIAAPVNEQDYGYPYGPGSLANAFAERMRARFNWDADKEFVTPVTDLVQALFALVHAFTDPGQGVVLQSPAYPPMWKAIKESGRRVVEQPTRDDGSRHVFDITDWEDRIDRDTRLVLLCNPHNPTGRVLTREELLVLGQLAIERDLIVVADEVHAELVYENAHHVPFASLGKEIAARTVTITSATKAFNFPGLRTGVMHFGSAELRQRFEARIPQKMMGSVNILGIAATVAAWTDGDAWLQAVVKHLQQARNHLLNVLAAEIPEIRVHRPEATYLAWLDCSRLNLKTTAFRFFLEEAKVAMSAGETFDESATNFVRLNFATSMPILDQILGRMVQAVKK